MTTNSSAAIFRTDREIRSVPTGMGGQKRTPAMGRPGLSIHLPREETQGSGTGEQRLWRSKNRAESCGNASQANTQGGLSGQSLQRLRGCVLSISSPGAVIFFKYALQ